jgi:hypothetical protein
VRSGVVGENFKSPVARGLHLGSAREQVNRRHWPTLSSGMFSQAALRPCSIHDAVCTQQNMASMFIMAVGRVATGGWFYWAGIQDMKSDCYSACVHLCGCEESRKSIVKVLPERACTPDKQKNKAVFLVMFCLMPMILYNFYNDFGHPVHK